MIQFNLLNHINGKDRITVIWLFNIGVEKYWNENRTFVKDSKEDIVVNHIEEINLLVTKKQDIMILRRMPDKVYLEELSRRGYEVPYIICPNVENEELFISEVVLRDETFKTRIDELIEKICKEQGQIDGVVFVPYGVSILEENIAKRLNIKMFGSAAEINKKINDKVFSRELALDNGFKVSNGVICKSFAEVEEQAHIFLERYGKIIIKEPCGASGKGLWVVDCEDKLKSVLLVIKRFLRNIPDFRILVEEWCNKKGDLNYQVYVGENGEVEVFSIKQQLLEETVYIGSFMPPNVPNKMIADCKTAGEIIGQALSKIGYVGVIGVDALWLEGDVLVPIIEINARFTLSTYLSFQGVGNKLVFYKKINLNKTDNYSTIRGILQKNNLWLDMKCLDSGAFVYVSETINGAKMEGFGRLFCMINAKNEAEVLEIHKKVQELI